MYFSRVNSKSTSSFLLSIARYTPSDARLYFLAHSFTIELKLLQYSKKFLRCACKKVIQHEPSKTTVRHRVIKFIWAHTPHLFAPVLKLSALSSCVKIFFVICYCFHYKFISIKTFSGLRYKTSSSSPTTNYIQQTVLCLYFFPNTPTEVAH